MSSPAGPRGRGLVLCAALACVVLPARLAAQERPLTVELGAQADLVRLRFFDGGPAFAYFEGRGVGAFGRARYGMLELAGSYTRGEVKREPALDVAIPLWQASARLLVRVAPWLSLGGGPEAWRADGAPALEVVAWMIGGVVEVPLVPGVADGRGAFSAALSGDAGTFGTLSNGAVAEIGVALADSSPLALAATYRISRHAWSDTFEGSHRLEELELRVGVRLR